MTLFVCHGCGARLDPAARPPFACPQAVAGDDIDHVLVPVDEPPAPIDARAEDPFLRYRAWLSPYRLARAHGLPDDAWATIVGTLDRALTAVDGGGFRVTPTTTQPELAAAAGLGELWVKDETRNVSGSHKARHLMGVMLYLRVIEAARLPAAEELRTRRLAIASCGNAALAAAVVARAAGWPLDVFIPTDAEPAVVPRLNDLGAAVRVCPRQEGERGDPCVTAFRAAVREGAIPFGVQGPDNGLAVEGARTLAFEMAETLAGRVPTVFVQVGGGALASAVAQGFAMATVAGLLPRVPRLMTVQTTGCAPLARAWKSLDGVSLGDAARHRVRHMRPWETTPVSIAHGILDDETYDWWEIAKAMRETGGTPLVVDEPTLARALALLRTHTRINASATGSAGLAGALAAGPLDGPVAVIFSGVERNG